jgi:putative ABC transport system ATP-binding protein
MLMRPKLILADEPTASLDDAAAGQVGNLLLEAARETGAALVIATHDQRLKALVGRTVMAESLS